MVTAWHSSWACWRQSKMYFRQCKQPAVCRQTQHGPIETQLTCISWRTTDELRSRDTDSCHSRALRQPKWLLTAESSSANFTKTSPKKNGQTFSSSPFSQQEAKLVDTSPTHWHVNPQTSPLLLLWALLAGLHHRASHFLFCFLPLLV